VAEAPGVVGREAVDLVAEDMAQGERALAGREQDFTRVAVGTLWKVASALSAAPGLRALAVARALGTL
jgi:hypothetical protein